MATAFQPTAFQNDSFQIDFRVAVTGYAYVNKESNGLNRSMRPAYASRTASPFESRRASVSTNNRRVVA